MYAIEIRQGNEFGEAEASWIGRDSTAVSLAVIEVAAEQYAALEALRERRLDNLLRLCHTGK